MVQEVQTWVWVYNETTLETIEAIGTSSFKIVEWRQTKWWHYISSVTASGSVARSYSSGDSRQSPTLPATNLTITSSSWKATYTISEYWIRVPSAWTYRLTIDWNWWSSTMSDTLIIKKWTTSSSPTIYTKTFSGSSQSEIVNVDVDLGKFEIITLWGSFYYWWSSSWAYLNFGATLTLQQL